MGRCLQRAGRTRLTGLDPLSPAAAQYAFATFKGGAFDMPTRTTLIPIATVATFQQTSVVLVARFDGANHLPITVADVSEIKLYVFDIHTSNIEGPTEALTHSSTLVAADVISDTLILDDQWTYDAQGYNLRVVVPPTAFPKASRAYQIEVKITLADGVVGHDAFRVHTREELFNPEL